ncbi:MAG: hypothetical protein L0154_10610 [Chloroflexi bacterium]|nr:hypothetical protein [Chloroflexota bacterium]
MKVDESGQGLISYALPLMLVVLLIGSLIALGVAHLLGVFSWRCCAAPIILLIAAFLAVRR